LPNASKTNSKSKATKVVKDIRRANRKLYSAEEKIRIIFEGLRGESSITELCRKEGIAKSMYYSWSKKHDSGWGRMNNTAASSGE